MDRPGRRSRGVTIIDVARHAGVSPMTVSRVMNADPGVRPETRSLVERSVRALNYTPNLTARSLVTSRDIRIGVLYSNPSAAFMSAFLAGVFEEASVRGAQLILLKGDSGALPSREAIERLIASRIGGVILAPPLGEIDAVRAMLHAAGLPIAVVGAAADDTISVNIDHRRAAHDMTRHLIELGHLRIGFILGNPDQGASADRRAGFEAAVAEAGIVTPFVAQGDFSYASGLVAAAQLLDAAPAPTAIFASNDDMAAAVVSVAHRRHLDVPADLTVVGFDDSSAAVTLWPPLTTIHQPVQQLAAEALQRLIGAMRRGARTAGEVRLLDHHLVERDSTAPPAA